MNWDQIEGRWKQFLGETKRRWGELTDDELQKIAGNKDRLVGALQERYGYTKEQADKEVKEFAESMREPQAR